MLSLPFPPHRYDATDIASGIILTSTPGGVQEAVTTNIVAVEAVPPLDAGNVRFCGSINAIMPIESDTDIKDAAAFNNAHVAPMVLVCDANGNYYCSSLSF